MTDEQEPEMTEREDDNGHWRRRDDYRPVEIAKLSNGARRNAMIQTVTLVGILVTLLGTFATLVWFLARLAGGVEQNTELVMRAIADGEATRTRVRVVEENQAEIGATVERSNVILDRIVLRLDDTRDRVIRMEDRQ